MNSGAPYDKIVQIFKLNGINYKEICHKKVASAIEYQAEMGTNLEEQAKALLLRYKNGGDNGFYVIALQAQKQADLKKLKALLDVKTLKLAQKSQLVDVTGCNFGELPPLGSIFGLQLILDRDLLDQEKIYFNAGRLDKSFVVKPDDIVNLENPILTKI